VCRFGVLNKVVLLFPEQWWDTRDTFGHVVDPHEEPGWFYLWYCYPGLSGALPARTVLVSAQAALLVRVLPPPAPAHACYRHARHAWMRNAVFVQTGPQVQHRHSRLDGRLCAQAHCSLDAGGHMVSALVSGEAARQVETLSDTAILDRVMTRLRTYHPDRVIPDPVAAAVTAWGSDPYTLGSYSSVPPGCAGADDYKEVSWKESCDSFSR
jgi:Flavin containing amine oxidoreductase